MRSIPSGLRYGLAFVPLTLLPLAAAGIHAGIPAALASAFPLLFLFVIVPIADTLIGTDRANVAPEQAASLEDDRHYRWLTWLMVPIWLSHLAWALYVYATAPLGGAAAAMWIVSLGVVGGVSAINTAHELIHKTGRLEPGLGGLLLASVIYAGFKVEHVRGHHVHVSTPLDTSSARLGQSVYDFLPRALVGNAAHAWSLEAQRLRALNLPALHWRNELIAWYALSVLIGAAAFFALGWGGVIGFAIQGFVAAVTLEVINYIEHYGLERRMTDSGRYERVTHHHSWNAAQTLTNAMLFQLQRHADHHPNPRRRYQALRHHEDSPQLPGGYASMFVLALVPPIWRRVVDPRVRERRIVGVADA
ncbi:MAG TPA: alkane 1-monooxygenase [Tahibacter sp.]|uniref:alkane 1-monooxygenase n=1 Tax=Tahibacter sp. TaxID=2056211 RepID=UPI002BD9BABB|nr:alkane 1-monooxygenase [Tahibacter sp.]HSX61615.1 alkane 1-monooxygenase [Tahibacter sp.]